MANGQGAISDDEKSSNSGEGNPKSKHGESKGDEQKEEADEENIAEGLEAEKGDFVNVEVAFSYRARTTGARDLRNKSKNAHLFLAFYLPGGIKFRKSRPSPVMLSISSITTLSTSYYRFSCSLV